MTKNVKKIGFIIGNQLDEIRILKPIRMPSEATGFMRFGWVSDLVNNSPKYGLKYELYRPWHRYDMIVFIKSMGTKSIEVLHRNKQKGKKVIFDANVNYYELWGKFYYEGMSPTEQQRQDAIEITSMADAVIADSTFLEKTCLKYNSLVFWVPDNVNMELVPPPAKTSITSNGRLVLLWSGQAIKLFELLAIEDVLKKFRNRIRLILITNSLSHIDSWYGDFKARFLSLLNNIEHDIIPFQSIAQLLDIYSKGGICISPRFLDNSYNMGHSEWKITLGMACRNMVLCSPLQSYVDVAERASNIGIRICHSAEQWEKALNELLIKDGRLEDERDAARALIESHYSTKVIAAKHAAVVQHVLSAN